MSDVAIVAAFVKSALTEISKQSQALGEGLKNAAPGATTASNSVQYLLESANYLNELAKQCDAFLPVTSNTSNLTPK